MEWKAEKKEKGEKLKPANTGVNFSFSQKMQRGRTQLEIQHKGSGKGGGITPTLNVTDERLAKTVTHLMRNIKGGDSHIWAGTAGNITRGDGRLRPIQEKESKTKSPSPP